LIVDFELQSGDFDSADTLLSGRPRITRDIEKPEFLLQKTGAALTTPVRFGRAGCLSALTELWEIV